jgi:hypothetical protein
MAGTSERDGPYMFAMPWYNPRCFLDGSLVGNKHDSGGEHTMVSDLILPRSPLYRQPVSDKLPLR